MRLLSTFILISCLALACSNPKQEVTCSTIFKMIHAEVTSTNIDSFYTLRASNQDIIHLNAMDDDHFTVLNDTYQDELENSTDTFYFIGLQQDSIVIKAPFVIGADECHIYLIEGETSL